MPRVNDILDYVENTTYRRALARTLAESLIPELSVEGLASDEILAKLLAKLNGADLFNATSTAAVDHLSAMGLGDTQAFVQANLDELFDAAVSEVLDEAGLLLGARADEVGRAVGRMAPGVLTDAVEKSLLSPYASVLRDTAAGLLSSVENGIFNFGAEKAAEDGEEDFTWETRGDDRVCFDQFENSCEPRHGWNLSLSEWDSVGRPKAENLMCSTFAKGAFSLCRCVLLSGSAEGKLPGPLRIAEAAQAGRARAQEEAASEEAP